MKNLSSYGHGFEYLSIFQTESLFHPFISRVHFIDVFSTPCSTVKLDLEIRGYPFQTVPSEFPFTVFLKQEKYTSHIYSNYVHSNKQKDNAKK